MHFNWTNEWNQTMQPSFWCLLLGAIIMRMLSLNVFCRFSRCHAQYYPWKKLSIHTEAQHLCEMMFGSIFTACIWLCHQKPLLSPRKITGNINRASLTTAVLPHYICLGWTTVAPSECWVLQPTLTVILFYLSSLIKLQPLLPKQ